MLIGDEGHALEEMTTHNYIIHSLSGLAIVAKDVLILDDKTMPNIQHQGRLQSAERRFAHSHDRVIASP